jgi:hypothetical protein
MELAVHVKADERKPFDAGYYSLKPSEGKVNP